VLIMACPGRGTAVDRPRSVDWLDNENENRSHNEVRSLRPSVVWVPTVVLVPSVVVVVALAAAGCSSGGEAAGGASHRVKVVAAENFWGDIASQVGGGNASVTSIISDPTADPHQYESDARDAAAVADADLVIVNGAGYDDFVSKLLSSTSHKGRVVLTVADLLHAGNDANPHLWYDLPRIPEVARAIESALARAEPSDRAGFEANLATFLASLAPLDRIVGTIKTKYAGAPVAYTERVPRYLLDAAGLTVASPPGFARAIEDGNEPSAGDTQSMDDLISNHRVRVLLYNAQATSAVTKHVQDLAHSAGVAVVGVTETMPKNEPSYRSWQQHQLEALLRALGG
jgi:zinc/manganese transport system substrate-binding protein